MIQILQVIFAPVPGEATGFIGGFLFGTIPGFIYSSIGLTIGSWLNFMIGRLLGRRFVRKLIPTPQLTKIDAMLKRQGIIVVFILFVSNSVNITDGLDGLAIGSLLIAWTTFVILTYAAGNAIVA